ncbi:diaminobutyrate--2-oxoglutarate transaminase [Telmatospirillum sp. J64-1]|uniref:diaminobutyrate--2-oxoglutarate transaminase n=1 Tax=Telmatospirillum sp. J64-1 TaxID=2502183 RepID=UPI00115E7929|nr:diaminobutyrate--2-oxoglutarate transaminase [Telmatospirillum sp. J64-1]
MKTFEELESKVRSYVRDFPTVFTRATGHTVFDENGRRYIDFFAGAGVLNYGHNNPLLKARLIDYMSRDGIAHGLDMATEAKRDLLNTLNDVILAPRDMKYKVMFPGPTGTNSVESALKLARKITGRSMIIGFTNGFHGMTMGSLAVTGNSTKRGGAGIPLTNAFSMPFDGYLGEDVDTVDVLARYLDDRGSGMDLPAAVIVETVQGEGGINVASFDWLKRLEKLCRKHGMLMIVDDIQMGCGRTGPFFSFEPAGIKPDIICLSKAIGGFGLPLALTLFKPEYDKWTPGEHNGTFRGNNLAFVAATEALMAYWQDDGLEKAVQEKGEMVRLRLEQMADRFDGLVEGVRGRGLVQGMVFGAEGMASAVAHEAFSRGLIIETAGFTSNVLKVMPPLTICEEALVKGLDILEEAIAPVARREVTRMNARAAE